MILDDLANHARKRVTQAKATVPFNEMRRRALSLPSAGGAFEAALQEDGVSLICEVKKASPSKGVIDPTFDYQTIAQTYEKAGADAISCLTEPKWFQGSDEIFTAIRKATKLPMLRKDFTIDEYQIYEAHCLGADAVLLICALLDDVCLEAYLDTCYELGIDAVVEAHDENEIARAVRARARIIGVNNRDLRDFTVDSDRAAQLRNAAPADTLFIAESGITSPEDVRSLASHEVDAVLVGEALMRASDKSAKIKAFREAAKA